MAITFDKIGTEEFISLDGDIDVQKPTLSEITRPAVDGRAWRDEGERANIVTLSGVVDVDGGSAADTKMTTYSNMIGTTVSIRLRGQTRTNYLVVDVITTGRKALATAAGGVTAGTYLVSTEWTLTRSGVD